MKIKYTLDAGAYDPEKAHYDDAGFDLKLPDTYKGGVTVFAGGYAEINLGVHMQIPHGYVGMLKSKSGLNVKHQLRGEGVIDAGYIGPIVAKIYNDSQEKADYYKFKPGEKVIQIVIIPIPDVEMKRVLTLDDTERMLGGFGSTGK